MLRDSTDAPSIGQAASIQRAAATGMEITLIEIRDADTASRGIAFFARRENGGLIGPATPLSTVILKQSSRRQRRASAPQSIRIDTSSITVGFS
jgi:hypothetical protein